MNHSNTLFGENSEYLGIPANGPDTFIEEQVISVP